MKQINHIPSMTPKSVHEFLVMIGSSWLGQGVAVELGSWLGATAAPLLTGLVSAGYDRNFWAFDKWSAIDGEVEKAKEAGLNLYVNQDLLPLFLEYVKPIYPKIKAKQGKLPGVLRLYSKEPIEICLFDAPKRGLLFNDCIKLLLPYFIPGVTVFGMMDYYFYKSKEGIIRKLCYEPVRWMNAYSDHFEKIKEWRDAECVFFKYIKKIGGE